jgi:chorismate synthase
MGREPRRRHWRRNRRLPAAPTDLGRRNSVRTRSSPPRPESDSATIVSGVFEGQTTGTPIGIYVPNGDHRPSAYKEMKDKFRPSHADFTYQTKFGIRNHEGGGRSSARETIGRVAAGAIAKKILKLAGDIEVRAYITRVHDIQMPASSAFPTLEEVEASPVRCPHPETAEKMIERIKAVRNDGDSVGGIIECRVRNLPVGLGVPVFDRLEADLAKAMLSIPATKGFEIGSGFGGSLQLGSEHNDIFINKDGKIGTETNRSGGVQGGISNGEEVVFRVAFKPTATLIQNQRTVDKAGNETELMGRGRHDPCVVPRAVPIVESMAALVVVDHWMRYQAQCQSFDFGGK